MTSVARNAWLDSLRALAIFAVLNCHAASNYCTLSGQSQRGIYAAFGLGGHGVDLFFVLSGWLLGNVLFRELETTQTIDVRRFWMRRWLRTLPAYFAILALTLLQRTFQGRIEASDAWFFIFGQTYAFTELPFFGISWSLCVEEHFYLLVAPLLLLGYRRKMFNTCILLGIVLIPSLLRAYGLCANVNQTHARIDQCAVGVLLAHVAVAYPMVWEWLKSRLHWLVPSVALVLLSLFLSRWLNAGFELPLLVYALMSGVLVVLSQASRYWSEHACHPIVRFVATRSYSLYLVHIEAMAALKYFHVSNFLLYLIATWTLSLAMAELLYRCVELPGMRLRDRSIKGPRFEKLMPRQSHS